MRSTFSKVVVARHSPKNKCNAPEGTVLFVRPRGNVPLRSHVSHHFLSTVDRRTRSRYAWVRSQPEPFSLEAFVAKHLSGERMSDELRHHLLVMFSSIESLADDTPVAATYSLRGVESRHMDFDVHRVIFYRKRT